MIAFILTLVLTVIGFFVMLKYDGYEIVSTIGFILGLGGIVTAVIMSAWILFEHVGVDVKIEEKRIEYEALCERYEITASEYEDVSKSDVIKDVAEWNKEVYSYKHWAYNPWTSWFYSRRLADKLEMIER